MVSPAIFDSLQNAIDSGFTYSSQYIDIKVSGQQMICAFIGGLLIAIASSIYYAYQGRILGMSGIIGAVVTNITSINCLGKLPILSGLLISSISMRWGLDRILHVKAFDEPEIQTESSVLMLAGFLVGMGTYLGSGCTSGHGLCGLPRFSIRSITAVLCFLSCGILAASFNLGTLVPSTPQSISFPSIPNLNQFYYFWLAVILLVIGFIALIEGEEQPQHRDSKQKFLHGTIQTTVLFYTGLLFGLGLLIGGMVQREKLYSFLNLAGVWNFSLMIVLFTGVIFNGFSFNLSRLFMSKSVSQKDFSNPHGYPTLKLIVGSCLFGVGWGLGGLCPGPFLLLLSGPTLNIPIYWGLSFLLGRKLTIWVEKALTAKSKTE